MGRRHGVRVSSVEDEIDLGYVHVPRFPRVYWTREPHLRRLYLLCMILMVASATTGYDGMLVNTSQQINRWNDFFGEDVDNDSKLGLLINMFNIGSICSFFITPYIADRYGRKPAIIIGCLFMVLGGCLTAFCNGYAMYMAGRFSLGFGNSLAQMASPLLLTEICHPQHRGPVTAIYNCLWNAGALLVSCIGWATAGVASDWSWRSITFLQIVPSAMQLLGIWWLPESPRYLVNTDQHEEALLVLARWHGGGQVHDATVQFEFLEIKETIRLEKEAAGATSYVDFVRTRGNRWRLAILVSLGVISQYSGNALFSSYMNAVYGGAGIAGQGQKLALSTGKTLLDLVVTVWAALMVDRWGRRPLFLVSTGGMAAAFAAWTAAGVVYEGSGEADRAAGYAQLAFIWVFGVFYDIGFSGLLIAYALEILPFSLRAKGMMIMNMTVQAVLALSNQTNKLAWDRLPQHWNFTLFYALWDLVELAFVWAFYPETKGPTLEEIGRIFDGDGSGRRIHLRRVEKEVHKAEQQKDVSVVAEGSRGIGTAV